jgi:hypothetical protein
LQQWDMLCTFQVEKEYGKGNKNLIELNYLFIYLLIKEVDVN